MDYLLLSESEVQSVSLSEKQRILRDAVNRILSDEDPMIVAAELLKKEIINFEDINEMVEWIKSRGGKRNEKGVFHYLRRRGSI